VDPTHPPGVGDSLDNWGGFARKTFADYFRDVFAPYYLAHRPGSTAASLLADNRLDIIADTLEHNPDYFAMTNNDDPILSAEDLAWLRAKLGSRIVATITADTSGILASASRWRTYWKMLAGRWAERYVRARARRASQRCCWWCASGPLTVHHLPPRRAADKRRRGGVGGEQSVPERRRCKDARMWYRGAPPLCHRCTLTIPGSA